MGKFLLILMFGLSLSTGMIVLSKNRQLVQASDMAATHFSRTSAKNAANSGAYIALNKLYLNSSWRPSYGSPLVLNKDSITIAVQDTGLASSRLKVFSTGKNADLSMTSEVILFDGEFSEFAVWAKDSVNDVTTRDSTGVIDTTLVIDHAPFMPDIDYTNLLNAATSQGHTPGDNPFEPGDGYPSTNFYYSGLTPNVTHVNGDLRVLAGRTVYGIFIVEGATQLFDGATIEGVVYSPNTGTLISNSGSAASYINGGIVTWGAADGLGFQINVDHEPEYMRALASNYAPNNPRMRVLSWK